MGCSCTQSATDNGRDSLPYSKLIEVYSQRLTSGDKQNASYLDYDTSHSVNELWKRIQKNGETLFPP